MNKYAWNISTFFILLVQKFYSHWTNLIFYSALSSICFACACYMGTYVIPSYLAIRQSEICPLEKLALLKKICFFQNMLWKTHHYVGLLAVSCLNYYYMFCLQEACTVWYAGCNTRGSILSAINGLGALLYRLRFICESVYLVSLDAMFYWYSIIHCTYPT